MTAPVDVRAVMKDAANAIAVYRQSFGKDAGLADELDTARAAVAELIDAADALSIVYGPLVCSMRVGSERRLLWEHMFAVMRSIGGAK